MIVTALALTTGACTIHRHYHQAPAGPNQATSETTYSSADATSPEGPPGDFTDDEPGDQPLAPEYARPNYLAPPPAPSSPRTYSDYRYERRYSHRRHDCDCDCDGVRSHRRPAVRRSPGYRIHPGPVVPDNPVEWLE